MVGEGDAGGLDAADSTGATGLAVATDLGALAEELLARAAQTGARRAARTLAHPVDGLRQTVVALLGGSELQEHESPGAASLLVLRGRARLVAGDDAVVVGAGEVVPIPPVRHSLHADEDTVVLLSVAVPGRTATGGSTGR
jgi:quercetin dioxygenase-like cupin family protein